MLTISYGYVNKAGETKYGESKTFYEVGPAIRFAVAICKRGCWIMGLTYGNEYMADRFWAGYWKAMRK